eukprot:5979344-Ditylum_brightwellii.AAC.1
MDELAKKRQAPDVYTGVPIQRQLILPSNHKVCNSLNEEIKLILKGGKIKKYWADHHMIPDSAVESIDWSAISKARDKQSFHQRKWTAKWAAEKIPVGVEMQDRGHWETAE